MKRNDWILTVAVLLYSFLFYHQMPGINFLIFNMVIVMFLVARNRTLIENKNWILAALGCLLSALCVTLRGNLLSVIANLISLSILSGLSWNTNSSVVLSLLFSIYSYLSAPVFMVLDYIDRKAKEGAPKGVTRKLILIIAPVLVTVLFFFMYRASSTLFNALASKINLDFISGEWIMFTLLGTVLLYGFFYYKRIHELSELDDDTAVDLSPIYSETSYIFGRALSLVDENFSGIVMFALLNVLVFIVNVLDVNFIFGGQKLPAGVTYAEFIHQGVGMLIVSIIVAISIILFYFRGGLNFYKDNKTIKVLACVWVVQNAFMLFSNIIRNNMCVEEYGLSYKHIGVYVYLLLTLVGLATTLIKVLKAKNNMYLFRKNGWIFYALLIILAFPDWDRMITTFNLSHVKKPNTMYLLDLSNSGLADMLPAYENFVATKGVTSDSLRNVRFSIEMYTTRLCDIILHHGDKDWRSWYYDDSRLYNDITSKNFTDKITVVDIDGLNISEDFVSMLGIFDHLTELHIHSRGMYSLKHLSDLKSLVNLDVSNSGLFDVATVGDLPNLQSLNISGTRIINYAPLYNLKNLKELIVGTMSEPDFNELTRNMPGTKVVHWE